MKPKDIVHMLNQADGPCQDFQVRAGSSVRSLRYITCQRGRKFRQSKPTQLKTSTCLPTSQECVCNFQFAIYHDKELDRYYVRQHGNSNWSHNDHPPVHRPFQEDKVSTVPQETLKVASELLEKLVPPPIVRIYIQTQSDLSLSKDALYYLRKCVLSKKHSVNNDESTAQKLIKLLDSEKNVSYVMYTGECCKTFFRFFRQNLISVFLDFFDLTNNVQGSYDEATSKVRVRKKNKKSNAIKTETEMEKISSSSKQFVVCS